MATLIDHVTARRDALQQRKQDAFDRFTAARQALDQPETGLRAVRDERTRELAVLNREIADARRGLSTDLTPAELESRVGALREKLAQRRRLAARRLDAEEEVARAEAELELARTAHQEAAAALATAETRLAEVEARGERLDRWQAALAEEPLASLPQQAHDARATAPDNEDFEAARQHVETIPEALRNRALARYQQQRDRLQRLRQTVEDAEDALADGGALLSGPAARVAAARDDLERAEASLADFAVRGPERLQGALGLLARVAAAPDPTAAEVAAMNDGDLKTDGEAAATAEGERDQARKTLADAEAALEARRLELKAADVDADPADDGDYQTREQAVTDAEATLSTREDAYTDAMGDDLDAWEATVPAALWADLLAFERARRTLDDLENADPTARVTAVDNAEAALVSALEDEAKAARTVHFLDARTRFHRERLRITQTLQERRIASAVRGDA